MVKLYCDEKARLWGIDAMRDWKTRDEPTNANLRLLESMSRAWPNMNADQATQRLTTIISIDDMLPKAVRAHFRLPSLYIGNAHYSWSQARLDEWWSELSSAIVVGLDAVEADKDLQKGGAATLDDRPPTRGEELNDACRAYSQHANSTTLDDLRLACSAPGLGQYFERLTYWLGRKRPAPGRRPIASELWIALSNIEARADYYHHHRASYRYDDKRRAEAASSADEHHPSPIIEALHTVSRGGLVLGQRVRHGKFGQGTITHIEGDRIEAEFDGLGAKRILETFLTAETLPEAHPSQQ
ncbi:hypothetical protein [Sphingopyxis sp. YR583]|uniref:hypothetical protein n=1 Tax=Sphingopyxis sp. YR583 TaxID=1881047 RepID=UPI00115FA9E6|nr:hypothetical protein [Sphingopyxis sp. YR583]